MLKSGKKKDELSGLNNAIAVVRHLCFAGIAGAGFPFVRTA
jgi:hypothetical protein